MDITQASLFVALIATFGMGLVLIKHIMFKRELLKLKEDMKTHLQKNGFDNELWVMFSERTHDMLRFRK